MPRILVREGSDAQTLGSLFKSVVQAVILFGSEMWVVTPQMYGVRAEMTTAADI